jgi:hypothetical protein
MIATTRLPLLRRGLPAAPARRRCTAFLAALALAQLLSAAAQARPRGMIHDWRAPISYDLELEPHLVFGAAPPGPGVGSGAGVGVRGSVVVAPEGFIDHVNDSVAVGFGLDYGHYSSAWSINGYRDQCLHFEPGPAGTDICTEVSSRGGTYNYLYIPVVMQWNFWPARRWSAFVEPGIDFYYLGNHGFTLGPAVYVGGRFLLTDRIALTLRIGYPTASLGASFMF